MDIEPTEKEKHVSDIFKDYNPWKSHEIQYCEFKYDQEEQKQNLSKWNIRKILSESMKIVIWNLIQKILQFYLGPDQLIFQTGTLVPVSLPIWKNNY